MHHPKSLRPTPKTPLKVFFTEPSLHGPFFVKPEPLAKDNELLEIADKEIFALAHLIHSAFREWKQR